MLGVLQFSAFVNSDTETIHANITSVTDPKATINYFYHPWAILLGFGIDTVDQFIRKRQDRFTDKFCASDILLCRVIYSRQWLTWILNWLFFFLVHYVRLFCLFCCIFMLRYVWWNKVVYIIYGQDSKCWRFWGPYIIITWMLIRTHHKITLRANLWA